jgi:hypothetical protein
MARGQGEVAYRRILEDTATYTDTRAGACFPPVESPLSNTARQHE